MFGFRPIPLRGFTHATRVGHASARGAVLWRPRASAEDLPPVTRLTAEDACKLLDVTTSASFEEILQAKNRKLAAADGDMDKVVEIESAYDILFMRSMKRRITGEVEVSTSVRYADVPATPKRGTATKAMVRCVAPLLGAAACLNMTQSLPLPSQKQASGLGAAMSKVSAPKLPAGGLPVGFAVPSNQRTLLVQSGVFGGLALWSLVQALLESPEAQLAETAGLQIALALGYAVYSLRENKKMGLGKATALMIGCLFAGALIGTGIESWLRVDIVPIGNFSSPGVFVSEVVIVLVALGSIFLV